MKFILDENLPKTLFDILKNQHKLDVRRVISGSRDEEIIKLARLQKRILLTLDTDFSNTLQYPLKMSPGIIVFRLKELNRSNIISTVLNTIETIKSSPQLKKLKGKLMIVKEKDYKLIQSN